MSPTIRRASGRSTSSSTSWSSSMIATRVSRRVALIRISLFMAHEGDEGGPFRRGDRPPRFRPEGDAIGCTHRQQSRETNERAEDHRDKVGEPGAREPTQSGGGPRGAGGAKREKQSLFYKLINGCK